MRVHMRDSVSKLSPIKIDKQKNGNSRRGSQISSISLTSIERKKNKSASVSEKKDSSDRGSSKSKHVRIADDSQSSEA